MIAVSLTWKLCTSAVDIRTCAEIKKIKIFFSPYLTEEQTISKWELGAILPEVEKPVELCETFHCSIDQLLKGNMDYSNKAYSDIRIVTVEPFRYISVLFGKLNDAFSVTLNVAILC